MCRTGPVWFGVFGLFVGLTAAVTASAQNYGRILSPTEQAMDIAVFRSGFLDQDHAFTLKARAEAGRRLAQIEEAARPMSTAEFLVALSKITALADNSHSSFFYPRPPVVTLTFAALQGKYYVVQAGRDNVDLLGAELVAIDARTSAAVRPMVRSLFGGIAAARDLRAADTLSRPALLHALGITTSPDSATYRMRTLEGRVIERQVSPSRRGTDWVRLPPPDHIPWALQDPDQPFRWRDAPDLDAIVVQLRTNADAENQKAADFLEKAETARAGRGRRNVVLDMRQDDGGDFLTTRDFMLSWPGRVPAPGRFFILEGPRTFSAGIASVAYLKQAAGDRAVLAGEPPGDRLMFFSEGHLVKLPASGAEVLPAGQRDDFATGCRGYSDCFAALAQPGAPTGSPAGVAAQIDEVFGRRPLSIRSLDPNLPAPPTIADYAAGRDRAMEAIAAYVRTHH